MFIELHAQSAFSFLEGAEHPEAFAAEVEDRVEAIATAHSLLPRRQISATSAPPRRP
jgi:two-component sensor histidine kinase